jgi:AcrR family transcriptional regulator
LNEPTDNDTVIIISRKYPLRTALVSWFLKYNLVRGSISMKHASVSKSITTLRTRRPRSKPEKTREQLVQAAQELFRQGGAVAVTTTSITQAIGLTQSGFYQHFSSVEECLQVAAEQCGERLRQFVIDHLQKTQTNLQDPIAAHCLHFRAVLQLCLDERPLAELLLRRRHEDSPIGRTMKQLHDSLRNDLLHNLQGIAASLFPDLVGDVRLLVLVDCLLAMSLSAGEMLLEGRGEIETLASELAQYTYALCGNLASRA